MVTKNSVNSYTNSSGEVLLPPQNSEAEKSVLGSLMLDPQGWDIIQGNLTENDFYQKSHQTIFRVMADLFRRGKSVDLLTVTDALATKGELSNIGGPEYIAEVVNLGASAVNLEVYVQMIKEKSLLRQSIKIAQEIVDNAYRGQYENIDTFLDQAEEKFFKLSETRSSGHLVSSLNIIHQVMKKIESLYQQGAEVTGLSSGFSHLDAMTSGFQAGELIIIAARPSMGKTAFSLNLVESMTLRYKKRVAYFALEMSAQSLGERLLALVAGQNIKDVRSGRLTPSSWPKVLEAASVLSEAPLFIDDTSHISPLEIRSQCRRLKAQQGLDCIVIDYLQLMKLKEKTESREREVAEISRTLKAIAKELQIPVIALAQLNRGVEGRTEKRPMLSDLRESGSIEQDADLIMMLYREDYYDKDDPEKQGKAEVIIAKQRNGPTGTIKFHFDANIGRFREPVVHHSPQPPLKPQNGEDLPGKKGPRKRELINLAPP
ncbi:MAG: replicative DNA helicase [Bdellovibrionaceae bacterium]|nr:replicative DNA helicase [Pseudobdellovibrionaceae bacterium]MDW8190778.1 replicative DNA helicase [Pseudobdellovibrionaceae bacterium]